MKIKKHFFVEEKRNIWRILISDENQVIIESREIENKEVFFNIYDLESGKTILKDYQFEEKFWIGIETIRDGIIFFHKFAKPDMPNHKQLLAFSINKQQILWQSDEYVFLFYHHNKIYCYKEMFEGRNFYTISPKSGEFLEDLGTDSEAINVIREFARNEEDFSKYSFTNKGFEFPEIENYLKEKMKITNLVRDLEFIERNGVMLFNYHQAIERNKLTNKFFAFDTNKNILIFDLILNQNTNNFAPDSFFIYDDYLILIKEKTELQLYQLT